MWALWLNACGQSMFARAGQGSCGGFRAIVRPFETGGAPALLKLPQQAEKLSLFRLVQGLKRVSGDLVTGGLHVFQQF